MMLNKDHPLPIYYQLKELLREKIVSGELGPGDLVPSERELSETHQISRMTARQALTELTSEGLLRREQGKGTFVCEPKISQKLTRLTGFTDDINRRGLKVGTQVLRQQIIFAPISAVQIFKITPGHQILLLERLRLVEDKPLAIETCHLHLGQIQSLFAEDLEKNSLYQLLTHKYEVIPTRAEQQVEAALCNQHEQTLLQIPAGAPVLRNTRITYNQWNRPFEYTTSAYRSDRYVFQVELTLS